VLAHKPTAMTVDFGMNDGGYMAFNEGRYKTYLNGLQGMAMQAKKAGIRVAWVTPQPLDGGEPGLTALTGYNQTLERFADGVREIAEKNEGLFVDQFHPYLAVLDRARAAGPKYERITGGDAVHPGPAGQALMAASILKGLHFPRLVASVEIDAAGRTCTEAKNTKVTDIAGKDGGLSFTRLDAALPFFPPEAAGIRKWAPVLEELNDYSLKVTGLKPGKYDVAIDGTKVAQFAADELGKGVNLAAAVLTAGSVAEQVKGVKAAVEVKNKFYHDRIFRGVTLANVTLPDWLGTQFTAAEIEAKRKSAWAERMAKMPELDAGVKKALEMKPHTVAITPTN
jgi:hypothetical protein